MRDIKKEIADKFAEIEAKEGVRILYAVESGSRSWGVESPDSDYDVRFVYVRRKEDYLCLQEIRDVIEWQLDEVLDISGWDLKKTLAQFHKGNATLFEWANSPIVYKTTEEWQELYAVCRQFFSEKSALAHYYGTAKSTFKQYLQEETVKYKKYVYALRPLLACRYIEQNHSVPPVRFEELLTWAFSGEAAAGGDAAGTELFTEIKRMLELKAQDGEKDLRPRLPAVQKYISEELERYEQLVKAMGEDRNPDWEVLNSLFRKILDV